MNLPPLTGDEDSPRVTTRRAPASPATTTAAASYVLPERVRDPESGRVYKKGRKLGSGGFAECFLFTEEGTNKEYAGKVVYKASLTKKQTERKLWSEIEIHKSLKQRYIVQFEKYFVTDGAIVILLALCENNTLMEMIKVRKVLTEPEVQIFGSQLVQGLRYLHEDKQIIHRDLKLGNLMLTKDMEIRIGDFGLAATLSKDEDRRITVCGTPNYIAPEVLDGAKTKGHSYEADIWGLGVVLYTLMVGKPPFETTNVKATYKKIKENRWEFPTTSRVSEAARDLIGGILRLDPETRLTLAQIQSHRFFRDMPSVGVPSIALNERPIFSSSSMCAPSSAARLPHHPVSSVASMENQFARINLGTPGGLPPTTPSTKTMSSRALRTDQDECVELERLHDRLERSLAAGKPATEHIHRSSAAPAFRAPVDASAARQTIVSVIRYLEEPSYGFAYLLSNGVVGVKFNDMTNISRALNSNYFRYVDAKKSETLHESPEGRYDVALKKKVRILNMLQGQLLQGFENLNQVPTPSDFVSSSAATYDDHDHPYKHKKMQHCWLFKFAGGTVQAMFFDGTDVAVQMNSHYVIFTNKTGEQVFTTMDVMSENQQIYKRVHYLKNVLGNIIQTKVGGSAPPVITPRSAHGSSAVAAGR